jgi:hypothetical protein
MVGSRKAEGEGGYNYAFPLTFHPLPKGERKFGGYIFQAIHWLNHENTIYSLLPLLGEEERIF